MSRAVLLRRSPLALAGLAATMAVALFAAGYLLAPSGGGPAPRAPASRPLPAGVPPHIALARPLRHVPPLPAPPAPRPAASAPTSAAPAPVAAAPAPAPASVPPIRVTPPSSSPPPVPSCIGPDC
jgi:hypothetical protein